MMCCASVDFPADSGPKISVMRPRGTPPMPSAMSSAIEPVGMDSMCSAEASPRRMIAPWPNCFSIWPSASSSAEPFSPVPSLLVLGVMVAVPFLLAITLASLPSSRSAGQQ
jgi:hypothetical protein